MSSEEAFVRRFHRDHPGATAAALARGRVIGGAGSSYDGLAAATPRGGRVLDLGCGDGYLRARLITHGHAAGQVVGLDVSADELARARAGAPTAALVQARAQALPFATGAFAAVVSHFAWTLMPDLAVIVGELARVLAPGGRVALRLFAAPAVTESLDAVAAALAAGAIGSFHALKWRVAMAIQPADRNVAVVDIGRAVEALCGDRAALAARTGWPRAVIDAIASYRGSGLRYSFPTQAEVIAALGDALAVVDVTRPGYELGERCPTVVWARR